MATTKAMDAAIKRLDAIERKTANGGRVVATKQAPARSKPKEVKKVAKSVVKTTAQARGVALPHDCVKEYTAAVANPWEIMGVKIPYNPMSVPTMLSTTGRVYNSFSMALNASETRQIFLWPGHGNWLAANPLDLTAAHCQPMTMRDGGGVDVLYAIGPVTVGPLTPVQGCYNSAGLALGTYNLNMGTAAAVAWTPMTASQALPFSGSTSDSSHLRWRLVSMGLVITNTTPELNIAGSVVTVQPDVNPTSAIAATGNQAAFETYPSFKRYPPNKQIKLSWIPRGEDLSWSHLGTVAGGDLVANRAGVLVFLNAGAAAQTYQIDWVANYEIAGNNVRAISSDAVNFPAARAVIEPAIAATHLTAPTAAAFTETAHVAAANNAPTTAPAGTTVGDQVSAHAKELAQHAASLLGQSAAGVLKALGNHAAARLLGPRMGGRSGPFYPGYHPRALTNY